MISLIFLIYATTALDFAVLGNSNTCPTGWTNAGGFCYKFTTGLALSWDDARTNCGNDSGELAIISSQYEQDQYVQYRKSLPQQGDPLWIGIHVKNNGTWSILTDQGRDGTQNVSVVYQNWKGGRMPFADPGMCIQATDEGADIQWSSQICALPLSFICEIRPLSGYVVYPSITTTTSSPGGGGGDNTTTMDGFDNRNLTAFNWTSGDHMFQHWRKIYPDSKFGDPLFTSSVGRMEHARSVVSCAILCTNAVECTAFNHKPSDNDCVFILKEVNDTDVVVDVGWDVWVEGYKYP